MIDDSYTYEDYLSDFELDYLGFDGIPKVMNEITVGSIIPFGRYLQSNGHFSAPTPINWIILETDGQTATLISEYALEVMPYDDIRKNVAWDKCTLRTWLNSTFLNTAFTTEEQAQLQTVTVTVPVDPDFGIEHSEVTLDKVFLLSVDEAEQFFASDDDRKCLPTEQALSYNTWFWNQVDGRSNECHWWLRSSGDSPDCAAAVIDNGDILYEGWHVDSENVAVRPVIVLRLN